MSEPIGIIAGESILPLLCVQEARRRGMRSIVAGIRRITKPEVATAADAYEEFALGHIGRAIRFLKTNGVSQAVMVGRVPHPAIYDLISLDRKFYSLLKRLQEKTTTSLLSAIADFFAGEGITILDSTILLTDLLAREGQYTPTARLARNLRSDIDFGWEKAWALTRLDVGQTVCVKDRAVVAVEAMEGTDQTIRRGYDIAGAGLVVIKVSRPGGEMRFDVPVIGPQTLKVLAEVQARALVVEAGRTLLLDEPQLVLRAKKAGLVLMGKK